MTYPVFQPPMPYADHHFTFNPHLRLSNQYHDMETFDQPLPTEKPSTELFAARETEGILRFLDEFDHTEVDQTSWDVKLEPTEQDHGIPSNTTPYSNNHPDLDPNVSVIRRRSFPMQSDSSFRMGRVSSRTYNVSQGNASRSSVTNRTPSMQFAHLNLNDVPSPSLNYTRRASLPSGSLPLLSTPQKRLNHIMSEQKRRNAIRDGYAQLIALLAGPEGSNSILVMPARGRPKGSGVKGKQAKNGNESEGAKGKSGVLFRAVEYCRWLEEGRDALKEEVKRVEAAAGILST
ncbi:hypothetical protein J3R30DRAFT_3282704 [Lentinula aciculospora]|uniref:BHLH domain-containing protein n=1 Tax=Lentinula aciculospora TaxID=153920 RepID=A0A9W9ALN3_9AGAR|nr:hypothetical protein J3R30DRAFT_3282704 [Lentinula aciculospora]